LSKLRLDAHEFIEVVELSPDQFMRHLRSGWLTDAATAYRGLDFLHLM
jgi:hypothetical protein